MKQFVKFFLLAVILCTAVVSVIYAVQLYRTKYRPRYFNGNAC